MLLFMNLEQQVLAALQFRFKCHTHYAGEETKATQLTGRRLLNLAGWLLPLPTATRHGRAMDRVSMGAQGFCRTASLDIPQVSESSI